MKLKYLNQKQFLTYSLISVFLAGCGGGGGESSPLLIKDDNSGVISTNGPGDGQKDNNTPNPSSHNYKAMSSAEVLALTGAGIIIGVNDTGFNIDNKPNYMLGDVNITNMYDFTNPNSPFLNNNYTPSGISAAHGIAMAQIVSSRAIDAEIIGGNALDLGGSTLDMYKAGVYLGDKGAKIINNSWGAVYSGGGGLDPALNPYLMNNSNFLDVFNQIHNKDLLFVMATGNDGLNEASATSRVPEIFPQFVDNFLAVTAQSEPGKEVNHCGSAKDWCLTAPLSFKYFNPYDGYEYISWGTSNATAQVSGVLAKVQQRYPWMNAGQLKKVVLGTSDDIGAIGVDSVYGWGLLNEEKAKKGYGTFAWGQEFFDVTPNVISYFDNNIDGTGGFFKDGDGTLVLNGNNTFSGLATVNNGGLVINGTNIAPFTINSNGKLIIGQEANISTGNLNNFGTLEVMESNLLVNGDYNQINSASLHANAGYKTTVLGQTNLDGKLTISSTKSGFVAPTNTSITILESVNNPINGEFSSLGYGNGVVKAFFDNTSKEIRLKLELGSIAQSTAQAISFMGKSAAIQKADTIMQSIQDKANNGQEVSADAASYYQQIAFSVNPSAIIFLDGATAIKNASQNLNIYQADLNNSLLNQSNGTNVFISYDNSKAKTSFDGMQGKRESNATILGGSYSLTTDTTIFGQVSNGSNTWTESMGINSNSSKIDFQGLTIGAKQNFGYFNAFAFLGYNDTKTDFKNNKFSGSQNYYGLGLNKDFNFDKFNVKPQISVQFLDNKFTANNTVQEMHSKQTTATLSMDGKYQLNDKLTLIASVAYDKDYSVKNNLTTNNFGVAFEDSNTYLPNDRFYGSIGFNYTPVNNMIVFAKYSHSNNSNWSNKNFNIGLKWQF